MPLPVNINDQLQGKPVEWSRHEFKEGWNPEEVLTDLMQAGFVEYTIPEKPNSRLQQYRIACEKASS